MSVQIHTLVITFSIQSPKMATETKMRLSVGVYGEWLTCGAFVSPESAASGAISEV